LILNKKNNITIIFVHLKFYSCGLNKVIRMQNINYNIYYTYNNKLIAYYNKHLFYMYKFIIFIICVKTRIACSYYKT